jgi:hypothetical protein
MATDVTSPVNEVSRYEQPAWILKDNDM